VADVIVPLSGQLVSYNEEYSFPDGQVVVGPAVATITVSLTDAQAAHFAAQGALVTFSLVATDATGTYADSLDAGPGTTSVTLTLPEGALQIVDPYRPDVGFYLTLAAYGQTPYYLNLNTSLTFDPEVTATHVTLDLSLATHLLSHYAYDNLAFYEGTQSGHAVHWGDRVTLTFPDTVVTTSRLAYDRVGLNIHGEEDGGYFNVLAELSEDGREVTFSLPVSSLCVGECYLEGAVEFGQEAEAPVPITSTVYVHLSVT
jgi:hypothetical protein